MGKRIISAIIGIAVVLAFIFLSVYFNFVINIFVAGVCAMCVYEFSKAVKTLGIFQFSIPSIAFAVIYPILVEFGAGTLLWYIYTLLMLSMLIFFHSKISFKEFAYNYSMTLIITLSLSAMVIMKEMSELYYTFYFVLALASPWLADGGAYFVGVTLGKHKLCPKISPKKTVEGAVGGVLVCMIGTLLAGFVFQRFIYPVNFSVNYFSLGIIAFIGSLISILGDLSFSIVKRSYSVKDYGDIIPGHGGMLDRFDSVVFFAPFMLIMIMYMPIIN